MSAKTHTHRNIETLRHRRTNTQTHTDTDRENKRENTREKDKKTTEKDKDKETDWEKEREREKEKEGERNTHTHARAYTQIRTQASVRMIARTYQSHGVLWSSARSRDMHSSSSIPSLTVAVRVFDSRTNASSTGASKSPWFVYCGNLNVMTVLGGTLCHIASIPSVLDLMS